MRYFVISEIDDGGSNVAVVLHDHVAGSLVCRSLSESFLRIFNSVSAKHDVKVVKDSGSVQVVTYGPQAYEWIDTVLAESVGHVDLWEISEHGNVNYNAQGAEELIDKYLGRSLYGRA